MSAYAQAFTTVFARCVVGVLLNRDSPKEKPLIEEELLLGLEEHERPEMAQEPLQLQKRRRVGDKQPETSLYGKAPTWKDIFRIAGYETSRVGGCRIGEGNIRLKLIQQLVPEFTVRLVVSCRGTDRHRTDSVDSNGDRFPWRKTMIVHPSSGEIRLTGPAKEWVKLPRLKQIRSTGPAKMSLSIFGVVNTLSSPSLVPKADNQYKSEDIPVPGSPEISTRSAADAVPSLETIRASDDQEMIEPADVTPKAITVSSTGWAPKMIPKHGPRFLALEESKRAELKKLHVNLGHPDPEKFGRFLEKRTGGISRSCFGVEEHVL